MDLPDKGHPQSPQTPPPKKELAHPVAAGAKKADRPATRRFLGFLFAESPRDLGRKIGREVVVPQLKMGLEMAAQGFLSGMLWGNGGMRPPSNIVPGTVIRGGGTDYRQISTNNSALQQAQQAVPHQTASTGNYKDVICPTLQQAEYLLANVIDLHNRYRMVTVADLYEAAGLSPAPSDGSYGWTSVDGARISQQRGGYVLEMPRPVLI